MNTTLALLTEVEAKALTDLEARRHILAGSEINRRMHSIVNLAIALAHRVDQYLEDFDGDEAKELLPEDAPSEAFLFGHHTFCDAHNKMKEFEAHLRDFLSLVSCDLPELPCTNGQRAAA